MLCMKITNRTIQDFKAQKLSEKFKILKICTIKYNKNL